VSQLAQHDTDRQEVDEAALVRGLSCGDKASISTFLAITHRPVYAMTMRLTADPDLCHDWTHEALLKILDELAKGRFVYQHPGCFWAWFKLRCRFLLINLYNRHRKQQDQWTAGEIGQELIEKLSLPGDVDPLHLIEAVEARDILESCLAKLASEDQRRALTLLLGEDLPYQTIADEMGTALNTVRSWIRRARIAVRRCILHAYRLERDGEE
jgi:RNA polymerase sigma factor (sigma-70 family)